MPLVASRVARWASPENVIRTAMTANVGSGGCVLRRGKRSGVREMKKADRNGIVAMIAGLQQN